MAKVQDVSGLHVSQDLGFERREWRVQRLAWIVVAAALVAAALGLLGTTGALSSATASGEGLTVGYDRFARFGAPMQVDIELSGGEGMRNVAISREWLGKFTVDASVPEPDSVTAAPDRYVFTFDVDRSGLVRLHLTPRDIGVHDAVLWGPAGARVEFNQLIYP